MSNEKQTNREHYLSTWRRALRIFAGWSEAEVMEWAERFQEFLVPWDDALFYHETPSYYLARALVPEDLARRLHPYELASLYARIQDAIEKRDSFCDLDPNYDWEAARVRVQAVLDKYGVTLEGEGTE